MPPIKSRHIHVDLVHTDLRSHPKSEDHYSIILYWTNGLSHPYHLDDIIFICRGNWSNFSFLFYVLMKIVYANRIAPGGTPLFAASHLGLFCLCMSHKKDARLMCVNTVLSHIRLASYSWDICEQCSPR